jgi:hypothetical protein
LPDCAFRRYLTGEVVADSVALQWSGLYARRWRLPRVVDRLLGACYAGTPLFL